MLEIFIDGLAAYSVLRSERAYIEHRDKIALKERLQGCSSSIELLDKGRTLRHVRTRKRRRQFISLLPRYVSDPRYSYRPV